MHMEALKKLNRFGDKKRPVVLCIMDGIACGKMYDGNAVAHADTPNLDWLKEHSLHQTLRAHGLAVGMPSDKDMGNSEIGHNTIGSGRILPQGATLVNQALRDGVLFESSVWAELIDNCRDHDSTLHFIGLFSIGNVHSHIDHLKGMLKKVAEIGIQKVRLHLLLDGRDMGETSALEYLDPFEAFLSELREGGVDCRIASGGGRMRITMDRYGADWEMVRKGWEVHVRGMGRKFGSAREAIVTYRQELNVIDQNLPPFIIAENDRPVGPIEDNDSVILFNFRGDRAMELCQAFETEDFQHFDRIIRPKVKFAGMLEYDSEQKIPKKFLVSPPDIDRTMGEYLANARIKQLAVSETQKYGHVTYFFNGNRTAAFNKAFEVYDKIPSVSPPFDHRPWMGAAEITDRVVNGIESRDFGFIRLNYPNGDMVGHTGNYQAAKIAVEVVDMAVGRLVTAVNKNGGVLVVTADHGNADEMLEWDKETGVVKTENGKLKAKTSHTLNPVPCYIYDPQFNNEYQLTTKDGLGISSLAATCLNLLDFEAPADYETSLIDVK